MATVDGSMQAPKSVSFLNYVYKARWRSVGSGFMIAMPSRDRRWTWAIPNRYAEKGAISEAMRILCGQ